MENLIKVICENTESSLFVREGTPLIDILKMVSVEGDNDYIAAWVDNHLKDLTEKVYHEQSIRFIKMSSSEGMRIYARTLFFILNKAISDILPKEHKLKVLHPVGPGYYCEIVGMESVSLETIQSLKKRMKELMVSDLPIVKVVFEYNEAIELFKKKGAMDKVALLNSIPRYFVTLYNLAGEIDNFFGAMAPSTGYMRAFDITPFHDGLMVILPKKDNLDMIDERHIQSKLFDVFRLNKQWVDLLDIPNIGELNAKVMAGQGGEMIKLGEALQERYFAAVADMIRNRKEVKLVLISGPSSSGKTSSSKRLSIQLQILGYKPHIISLDNYFVERDETPLDENGEYDFERLEAVDVPKFNEDLKSLFRGEQVELCKFSFHTGSRFYDGENMKLNDRSVLIVEGIHGLNPKLLPNMDSSIVFKIYASALTTLSMDDMNVVRTTDNRLLRRMVRDNKFRSRPAYETLQGWPSVRRGEELNIFPYQENADVMIGTSLFFEIPILKRYAMPILNQVPENVPEYSEVLRLKTFLNCFVDMPDDELPPTSILREFIGGSSFEY